MFNRHSLRRLISSRGRAGFVRSLSHWLGLADEGGRTFTDAHGNHRRKRTFRESRGGGERPVLSPREVDVGELMVACLGEEFVENWYRGGSGSGGTLSRSARHLEAMEARHRKDFKSAEGLELMEAGPGVDVTAFLNINTFSIAVGGLVEASILEAYQHPGFVVRPLFETRDTRKNGEKIIGTTTLGPQGSKGPAENRLPGMPHRRVGFGERWVQTPETQEMALAVEVNRETQFFDLTGQIMDRAESIGFQLGYREEMDCIDLMTGITNTYNYGGTGYNTYQTASPWINDHVNPLSNQADIEDSLILLSNMVDQENGQPISAVAFANQIVSIPGMERSLLNLLGARNIERRTGTASASDTQEIYSEAENIYAGRFQLTFSQLLYKRLTDADGGNLSAVNAKRWWLGSFNKAFAWMQNWPMAVKRANPDEYELVDRGVIAAFFCNYRGVPAVKEPRYIIRSKVV